MINANPTPKCFIVHVNITNNEAISLLNMRFGMLCYDSPLTPNYSNILYKNATSSPYFWIQKNIYVLNEKSCSQYI